ncbi:hypothetical protein J7443_10035 [Tropicibacter sp. R15_0]|uniref:hypothetical protein n=1 Tax=Tropicibacter sp. R15_0 TaxID=2821101 RepID=UPI001ADA589C|nr:hypothetical protein [Tropicibacter sp. R15_0]MBO9465566.1 hypothetical protein [Tropicibacter sp. R15_0]
MSFFSGIPKSEPILVCTHALADPDVMRLVYHGEDGVISLQCQAEHDMEGGSDWRWMHAEHVENQFPILSMLAALPSGHVAMYFPDYEDGWVVDTLI